LSSLPPIVREAWESREGPTVAATISPEGTLNLIYVTCVHRYSDEIILVADNYFNKTRVNLNSPGAHTGSLLFITKGGTSYQVKGKWEYHTDGPLFDDMKKWNPAQHPGHAVAALQVEQVYSGGKELA